MKKNFVIFYHRDDNDGVCSCAILKHYLINVLGEKEENITCVPSSYESINDLFTFDENRDAYFSQFTNVIITDVSASKWENMEWLYNNYGSNFVWVDHHAPIINESYRHNFGNANGVRDTHHSALWNMWKYLYDEFNEKKPPYILQILSAWDSFTFEQEGFEAEYCNKIDLAFTKRGKLNVDWFVDLMPLLYDDENNKELLDNMYELGDELLNDIKERNKKIMNVAVEKGWTVNGDRTAGMLVTFGATNSTMFETIKDQIQNGIAFKRNSDGLWTISLYNTNPLTDRFHCGNYLRQKYGGGGHEGAAGCQVSDEQFIEMLKNKAI